MVFLIPPRKLCHQCRDQSQQVKERKVRATSWRWQNLRTHGTSESKPTFLVGPSSQMWTTNQSTHLRLVLSQPMGTCFRRETCQMSLQDFQKPGFYWLGSWISWKWKDCACLTGSRSNPGILTSAGQGRFSGLLTRVSSRFDVILYSATRAIRNNIFIVWKMFVLVRDFEIPLRGYHCFHAKKREIQNIWPGTRETGIFCQILLQPRFSPLRVICLGRTFWIYWD